MTQGITFDVAAGQQLPSNAELAAFRAWQNGGGNATVSAATAAPPSNLVPVSLNSDQTKVLAAVLRQQGFHEEAFKLEGKAQPSFLEKAGARLDRGVTFKHVVYGAVAAGVLVLVYEGLAVSFDLPRMGLFDKKS